MWKKHWNMYEDSIYYVRNDIHNTFELVIPDYAEHMQKNCNGQTTLSSK